MEIQSFDVFSIEEIRSLVKEAVAVSTHAAEAKNKELIKRVETVSKEILIVTDQVRSLQQDNIELKKNNVDLTQRITVLNQDNVKFKETMLNQEQQISLLQKEFQTVQRNLKNTQETLNEKVKQIAEIQETLEKYEKEKQELSEKNTRLINENAELVNERKSLNTTLEDLHKEKTELENQKKTQQEEIEKLKKDLSEAQSRYSELERSSNSEISEKTRIIANEKLKCENLTQEGILIRKDRDQAKQRLAEKEVACAQIAQRLDQTRHELNQSQQTIARQKTAYQDLGNKLRKNDSKLIFREELQKLSDRIQFTIKSKEEIKKFTTELSLINLNALNELELQNWVKDYKTVLELNEDERRNLESNLLDLMNHISRCLDMARFVFGKDSIDYLPSLCIVLYKMHCDRS
ncbi:hypothetical protein [Candidatus Protochlamydia amoebophila]|uniref:Uncharacterized protein n=1 Tax=Protochlamydia amoebophila (strain UWE25) TaxID=264201 RepID=Q6M9K8_PARUW|nr:hypothetical protein [Candidatus Protochlamydia amoebophila]CAF24741.1 unnamed protein product [Candidatus Protochlamydia amoebophila UWE25]